MAGGRVLALIVSALAAPLLFRFLGQGQYGEYGSVIAIFNILMILVSSGINGGVRKYISEERESDTWKDFVFAYYFRIALMMALLAALSLAVGAYTGILSDLMSADYTLYFYLLSILMLAAQLREYSRRALLGLKLEHLGEGMYFLYQITFSVTAVGLAWLGYGVVGVILGYIISSLVVFFCSMFFLRKYISLRRLFKPIPDDFPKRELFNFNHYSTLYYFLLTSMYHVDVVLLDMMIVSEQVGAYKAVLVIVEFLWFAPKTVQSILVHSTSNMWYQGQIERIQELASRSTRYALLLTTLMGIGLGALAGDFFPLYYGADASEMVPPLLVLLPGTIGFAIARPLLSINLAKGEMKIVIFAVTIAAAINLTLNVLLIPRFGTVGAAIGTTCGYGSLPFLQVWVGRHLGYNPFVDIRFGRIALTSLGAAVPIVGLSLLIDNSLLALLVVPPVGFVAYSALAIATGAISLDEIFEILGSFPEPVSSKAAALRGRVNSRGD